MLRATTKKGYRTSKPLSQRCGVLASARTESGNPVCRHPYSLSARRLLQNFLAAHIRRHDLGEEHAAPNRLLATKRPLFADDGSGPHNDAVGEANCSALAHTPTKSARLHAVCILNGSNTLSGVPFHLSGDRLRELGGEDLAPGMLRLKTAVRRTGSSPHASE